jgi:hypothetical protein
MEKNVMFGLDLLINPLKKKKDEKKDEGDDLIWYNNELEKFRNEMINRIRTYDPYIHKEGQLESILNQLWLNYLWGNMNITEVYEKKK